MKKLVFLSLTLSAIVALAGPSTSGGGFAVVCRDVQGRIQSAELLDLYEARTMYGFELMSASGDIVNDYLRSVKNGYRHQGYAPPLPDSDFARNLENFMRSVQFLASDEKLPNLLDHGSQVVPPKSCQLEPLAIFYDTQEIITIDRQIWDSLDSLNQAALVTHEITYSEYRNLKVDPDLNSIETRRVTASDFAVNLGSVLSGIKSNSNMIIDNCSPNIPLCAETTVAYKISEKDLQGADSEKTMMRLQFTQLAGRALKMLTFIDVPQNIQSGQMLPVQSKQLIGWTAEVVQKLFPIAGEHVKVARVKLVIRRANIVMFEITLF